MGLFLDRFPLRLPPRNLEYYISCITYELVVDKVLAQGEGGHEVPAVAHGQLDETLPGVQFNRHLGLRVGFRDKFVDKFRDSFNTREQELLQNYKYD